ncbi:hypothetical protein ET272_20230, partial [Salmonella enterica]|nr:hypothetical protein [Salmonella enterica]
IKLTSSHNLLLFKIENQLRVCKFWPIILQQQKKQIMSSRWRINYLYREFFLLAFLKHIFHL